MTNFIKISLYISVFIPLYILIILKTFIDIIFKNISFNILNSIMLLISSILIVIGISGFKILQTTHTQKNTIRIIECTNITDQHFLNYFSLFVLFAITFDLTKVSFSIIYFVVLIFIGIVYIKNELFYINPFLNIIGYSFYNITFLKNNSSIKNYGKVFSKKPLKSNTSYFAEKNNLNLWVICGECNSEK